MKNQQYQKAILIIAAIGLIPIALSYGVFPEKTLTPVYGFSVENLRLTHIFRGVMGLYMAQLIFWFLGAYNTNLRKPALYSLIIFMLGIASGRILSLFIEGNTHWLLNLYLILELLFGLTGLMLLKQESKNE